jgi:tyrosyl-tRNA synthetase
LRFASPFEAVKPIAVRIDDEPVTDAGRLIQLAPGEQRKLSLGRKRHGILRAI